MNPSLNPSLFQVNARLWLSALSRGSGRAATLDEVPDTELDRLSELGFDLVYLQGAWQTGAAGREVALGDRSWREGLGEVLPDLVDDDVCGSCYAITGYEVASALGGEPALRRFRGRLRERGLRLILDFVPNHTALDHPWLQSHPEFYIHGTEEDLERQPGNYWRAEGPDGAGVVLAHGRDPYFPAWPDTLQLDYGNPALQEAMLGELSKVAGMCDGARCDMAMLVLPDVFERTWAVAAEPFWPRAIAMVREKWPEFLTLAEVYWDLEWELQQQGFEFTYDKHLYDCLRDGRGRLVRDHLRAAVSFQRRCVRFLENHDESRAAAVFSPDMCRAAAVIAFLCPGLHLFEAGQVEGAKARVPVYVCRAPVEAVDDDLRGFYGELMESVRDPVAREGAWRLLDPVPAWEGNWTWDCFVAYTLEGADGRRLIVAVNYSGGQSQCYLPLPFPDLAGGRWRLDDHLGKACYDRDGDELLSPGLYLDVPAWAFHVFELVPN